ncbi:hypothetical protein E1B28_001690 [Marasmius oreades]|uniref:non-specific serine/threonine protein kinase n=1 Tax=Marasmius oreades TaxID=181124 RepID=A0A9P7V443_9AGAR|nr:uncharacterized protein E1B28_001690 [Marasmius oreades]KAG7099889.1 hypothetical protein E1B28_001690 [Marasmius oreades]
MRDILALKERPEGWGELRCKQAIWQANEIENSVDPDFEHLTVVDYDVTSAAPANFRDINILPPRVLSLLWDITLDPEWIHWPQEFQVRRILSCIVSGDNRFFIPAKQSSGNITVKVHVPAKECIKQYSPFPDAQVRVKLGDDEKLLVNWLEVDSAAKGADRCKMLLLLNSLAKCFSLVPNRIETILLVAVYINYDRNIFKSTEITIFQVPPSNDNGPVQTFQYETAKGPDGASDFLNVMFNLLSRIGSCVSRQPKLFATVQASVTGAKPVITAQASGALTQTAKSSKHPTTRSDDGGSGGAGDVGGSGTSGAGGGHYPTGDGGDRHPPGGGGQADPDSKSSKRRRLNEPDVDRCDMAAQLPAWVPLSPSSVASATLSDGGLGEDDDTIYRLNSRSLTSALQEIVNRLTLPKLGGILRLHRSEDDARPFAMAKLASGKEVNHTAHLEAIPGTVKILSHHPVMRAKDTNILFTYYAGPDLRWYCSTYQYLSSKVPHPLRVAKDLLATIQAVHDAGLVHLDIKPANICIPDGVLSSPGAVLIDFGSSQRIPGRVRYPFGTVGWLAPEVESQQEVVDLCLVDVWATGKVLLYMHQFLPLEPEVDGIFLLKEVGEALSAPTPTERISLVAATELLG